MRLFGRPEIQQRIMELMRAAAQRAELSADRTLSELVRLAFSNIDDFVEYGPDYVKLRPSKEIPREALACVAEVSESITSSGRNIRFKLHGKERPLEILMRHLGLLVDKHDVTITEAKARDYIRKVCQVLAKRIKSKAVLEAVMRDLAELEGESA